MAANRSASAVGLRGGGIAATHASEPQRSLLVAPATEDQHNTVRAAIFPIACWRVSDIRFEFGSSFVRPEIAGELLLLALLLEEHRSGGQRPPLSVFGHADPVGDDEFNKQLSGRRAQAIYGLLVRDAALWEDLHSHPLPGDTWDSQHEQIMRQALGQPQGGVAGPGARRQLFLSYMDLLCGDLKLDKAEFLAGGADPQGKGDYQGCSAFNPVVLFSQAEEQLFANHGSEQVRDDENAPNRRVMVLLFRPGSRVGPQRWPCPRAKEATAGCRKRFWSDGEHRRHTRLPDARRRFADTQDTFACRFYHRLTVHSPCERPDIIVTDRWTIRVEREGLAPGDVVMLECAAAGYKAEVAAHDAKEAGKFLDFRFPEGPAGDYDVSLVIGGATYAAWRGLHLPEEGQGEATTSVVYGAQDEEPDVYAGAGKSPFEQTITIDIACG